MNGPPKLYSHRLAKALKSLKKQKKLKLEKGLAYLKWRESKKFEEDSGRLEIMVWKEVSVDRREEIYIRELEGKKERKGGN